MIKAITCATVSYAICLSLVFASEGNPSTEESHWQAMTVLACPQVIAALMCAWVAKKAIVPWAWLKFVGIYFVTIVVVETLVAVYRPEHIH